ncbi:hypothetical protein ACIREO_23140 [Streptomyces sp. NPDC102441]|uniref:hypothetical protein n=1 Tax=Streptomyces sp. NPDC102441 TaxID=3366176 RepID=UPI0037F43EC8
MESQHSSSTPSSSETLRRRNRVRDYPDAHARIELVMSDPAVRDLVQKVGEEEERLGTLLSGIYRTEVARWNEALREADSELLSQICPAKHGRHGRICLLDEGHDSDAGPHWGRTTAGRPVAWLGSAPDDD